MSSFVTDPSPWSCRPRSKRSRRISRRKRAHASIGPVASGMPGHAGNSTYRSMRAGNLLASQVPLPKPM